MGGDLENGKRPTRNERNADAAQKQAIAYLDANPIPTGLDVRLSNAIEGAGGNWRHIEDETVREALIQNVIIKKDLPKHARR